VSLSPAIEFADPSPLPPPPPARWVLRPADETAARRLADETGLPPLVGRILAARGIATADAVARFLQPSLTHLNDPFQMKGIHEAVARIGRALDAGEVVWIYGDYDVDGLTAMAILREALRELGGTVDYYIPHRLNEGYGLNGEAIGELAGRGATLIVTVDCGISALEEARLARRLGVDLIVTDHHEPGEALPEVCAIVNPLQPGCPYPCKTLAGVGVAFKLAHALLKTRHPDPEQAKTLLMSMLDLVALGTVADMVPLTGENRALVTAGLERLRRSKRPGLRRLCERAGLKQALLDASHISFGLGPRLNAAGRTEHATFAAELLITDDAHEAGRLAEQLEGFNNNRRAIEQTMLAEALEMLKPCLGDRVIVIAQDGWHPGVLGIVAARIVTLLYRPALVIGIDGETGKGSGRSIPGFDLHGALAACADCLARFGGHKMAAGLTIAAERIDELRRRLNAHAAATLDEETLRPLVEIDAHAAVTDLTPETVRALEQMAPYGSDNPKPVVALTDLKLVDDPLVMKGRHLKLRAAGPRGQMLTALGWNMAHRLSALERYRGTIRLAGTPTINEWNGRTSVELVLKDFQVG
jgi:single-stranded-DNA-specific exonuclease